MSHADDEFRAALVRAVSVEINCWASEFFDAGLPLARAIVDGRIDLDYLDQVDWQPYPADEAREVAHAAGLLFYPEQATDGDDQWRETDQEAVSADLLSFYGIAAGDIHIHSGPFSFYQETLDDEGLTLDEVRDHCRTLGLVGAAQLICDAYHLLVPNR